MSHIHERIDFTAEVFIVYRQRVLLRKHEKYHIWLGIGGHIELHEDPNEAAIREAKEEVGLDVTLVGVRPDIGHDESAYRQLITPAFMDRHRISATHEHVTLRFFARSDSDLVKPSDHEDRSDEWKWFMRRELDDPVYNIRSSIQYYAKAALDAVKE